ncbi:Uncharacterised protein [Mycobacteroides abscessus subsp. massiliense]|nr:Uncharacterised protein [Mycobacteroides abscessus subsp. massiliense]
MHGSHIALVVGNEYACVGEGFADGLRDGYQGGSFSGLAVARHDEVVACLEIECDGVVLLAGADSDLAGLVIKLGVENTFGQHPRYEGVLVA